MTFINVTEHKKHLIIKCPVYFSKKMVHFLESNLSQHPEIFFTNLAAIPMAVFMQKKEDWAVIAPIFYLNKTKNVLKSDQMLCFVAKKDGETCIICIEETEIDKFSPQPKKRKKNKKLPPFVGDAHTLFNTFKRKDNILRRYPFIEKEKTKLKLFFDEVQGQKVANEMIEKLRAQNN